MKRETILAINGGSITTESGVKTAIGDAPHEVGDLVWVDGSCVFGSRRPATPPVLFGGGVVTAPDLALIMTKTDYSVEIDFVDVLSCNVVFRFENANLKTIASECRAFCYDVNCRKFAWICAVFNDTLGYNSVNIYEIVDGVMTKNHVNLINSYIGELSIVAQYDTDSNLVWRAFALSMPIAGGNSYFRGYGSDSTKKDVAPVYDDYDNSSNEIVLFLDYQGSTLTNSDNRTLGIWEYFKQLDNTYLAIVKYGIEVESITTGEEPVLPDGAEIIEEKELSSPTLTTGENDTQFYSYHYHGYDYKNNKDMYYSKTNDDISANLGNKLFVRGGNKIYQNIYFETFTSFYIKNKVVLLQAGNGNESPTYSPNAGYWSLCIYDAPVPINIYRNSDYIGNGREQDQNKLTTHNLTAFWDNGDGTYGSGACIAPFHFEANGRSTPNGQVNTRRYFYNLISHTQGYWKEFKYWDGTVCPKEYGWEFPDSSTIRVPAKYIKYKKSSASATTYTVFRYDTYSFKFGEPDNYFSGVNNLTQDMGYSYKLKEPQQGTQTLSTSGWSTEVNKSDYQCLTVDKSKNPILFTCDNYSEDENINGRIVAIKIDKGTKAQRKIAITLLDKSTEDNGHLMYNWAAPMVQGITVKFISDLLNSAFENFTN